MKEPGENKFQELSWRQRLTDAERAALEKHLAANPETRADWEAESQLNKLLEHLPEAPAVASNFTSRVMQAVERESTAQTPARTVLSLGWVTMRIWLARAAVAVVVVGGSCVAIQQHQLAARKTTAHNVAALAEAYSAAGAASTEDFAAMCRLTSDAPAKPDTDLLTAMQ